MVRENSHNHISNVNIRRYVCHSIDVRDLVILKEEGL